MCQLLGLAFNLPVAPSLSFRGFRHKAEANPHGWGLAAFPDGSAIIFKEPVHAGESRLAEFVRDYEGIKSTVVIGHVRRKSAGEPALANTHPFCRELRGRHVVFAHNGTLKKDAVKPDLGERFTPVGQTDSEIAFCVLLEWMVNRDVTFTDFAKIEQRLRELNISGKLNVLFSEGTYLFAYHDQNRHVGLCYTRREAPFPEVSLNDEDWKVDLAGEKSPDQRGYVIASKELTNESWTSFDPGTLLVFRDGEIVYRGQPT
jgi:predicted glutamine amidotransferase